jgi:hypothetical protein
LQNAVVAQLAVPSGEGAEVAEVGVGAEASALLQFCFGADGLEFATAYAVVVSLMRHGCADQVSVVPSARSATVCVKVDSEPIDVNFG